MWVFYQSISKVLNTIKELTVISGTGIDRIKGIPSGLKSLDDLVT